VLPCRPDGRTLVARNFHIKAWRAWTMTFIVRTVNLMHTISIYQAHASWPWRPLSGHLNFEWVAFLMDERVRTGIHIVRTVTAVFPYLCFGKKSHSWSNIEWRPDVLLKCLDGCKLEQFEAYRQKGKVWTESSHRPDGWYLDIWVSGRYITSFGRLQGIRFHWLVDCAESSRSTLNSWIPV